jgi:hypothetical protein
MLRDSTGEHPKMKLSYKSQPSSRTFGSPVAAVCVLATMAAFTPSAHAQKDADAIKTLKAMSDY